MYSTVLTCPILLNSCVNTVAHDCILGSLQVPFDKHSRVAIVLLGPLGHSTEAVLLAVVADHTNVPRSGELVLIVSALQDPTITNEVEITQYLSNYVCNNELS